MRQIPFAALMTPLGSVAPRVVEDAPPPPPEPARRPILPWAWLLACAPLFAGGYLLLPTTGPARTIVYPIFGILATIAIVAGVRLNQPTRPRAWHLIALGLGLLSVGDVTYSLIALTTPEVPYPSYADISYLVGYAALALGVMRLVRGRMTGGDRIPMIDGAILAAGAASIFWLGVMRPSIEGAVDVVVATVTLSYPCMDLVLLGLAFRAMLSSSNRERSIQLLVIGLLSYFAADVIYAMAVLDGSYVDGHPVDALWIIGVTVIAVAALHPSAASAVEPANPRTELSRARLSMLALAAMLAPAIILVQAVADGADDSIGLVLTWTLLFGLVLIRLAYTVDELGVSLLHRRRLQDDLRFQAEHDPLTRLANRVLFERNLSDAMASAPTTTGLVFLDLDDFKTINDTLGHTTGDELLRIVADRIRRDLRPGDLAARLGGDEFAVLLAGCTTEDIGTQVAERILASLRAPVDLIGRALQVRASAGVAIGRIGSTPIDLMRDADVAMYQAKAHGKDKAQAYEFEAHNRVVRSYELRAELAAAIVEGQFFVLYQPAVSPAADVVVGAEALVRWRHPERGVLGPAEFLPHAETSGLIHDLGRWILREACRAAASWPTRADGGRAAISVNLSASQLLHPTLVADVADILSETGLAAGRLYLEVTESALVDFEPAAAALHGLRSLGIHLALDDFGTGYSSLSYLARLPFDVVKIDRAFVGSLGQDRRVEALLSGVVGLCRGLDLQLCAEGVETEAQLDVVRRLEFEAAQGFLFAKPATSRAMASALGAGPQSPLRDGRVTTVERRAASRRMRGTTLPEAAA